MDFDTTIAYDVSEQDSEPAVEPPVPAAPSVSDGAQDLLEPIVPVAPSVPDGAPDHLAQSASTVFVDADISQAGADVIAPANQSLISSGANAPEEVTWMDRSGYWGLQSLFNDSPTVHIYAQKGKSPLKGRGKKGCNTPRVASPPKKGYSPMESTSSKGRQWKVPAHLRNYAY